jgi:hypothetical protein
MSEQLDALLAPTAKGAVGRTRKSSREPAPSRESALLEEISAKLDRVVAVLAAQGKDKDKQVDILTAAGCDSAFIGTVVGITAGAVRMQQSRKRKKASVTREPEAPTENLMRSDG